MTTNVATENEVFEFANGVMIYRRDLMSEQLERYATQEAPIHEPVEEAWFERILASAGSRGCFVDIGAALGYYCVLCYRRRPGFRIVAVDPSPDFRARFHETLALNAVPPDKIELVDEAVYSGASEVRFARRSFGSHVLDRPSASRPDDITVPAVTLEALLARIGGTVTLAKLDIQGAELAVLRSSRAVLSAGSVEYWIIGTHGPRIHAEVVGLLGECHEILFEEQAPEDQPDGIVVARWRGLASDVGDVAR
ncbi:MAG: FkbM family methyltransferase [Hyphomicrobium sp.]|nr:FkbM family methyltransferase [Hyphomicrobium sp.]